MEFKKVVFVESRIRNQFDAWTGIKHDTEFLYRIFEDNDSFLNLSFTDCGNYVMLQARLKSVEEGKEIAQKHYEKMCRDVISRITV